MAADVVVRFKADTTELETAGARIRGIGKAMVGAIGATAIGVAIGKTVKAASDLNETVSASEQIFGKSAKSINKWASGAADDFGQSKQSALEAATSFGNMFQQLGVTEPQTKKMSKTMVELASDFASFRNADVSDVLAAQQAAFRGEYDALQKFVPTISAATVETKALAETGKDNAKQLTAQEKAHAAYTLMIEGAGKAMGDFDRTSEGAANKQRILAAQMADLQATVGQALLPVLSQALGMLSKVADVFQSLPGPVQSAAVALGLFAASWAVLSSLGVNVVSIVKSILEIVPKIGSAFVTAGLNIAAFIEQATLMEALRFTGITLGIAAVVAGAIALGVIMSHQKDDFDRAREAGQKWGQAQVEIARANADTVVGFQQLHQTTGIFREGIDATRATLKQYADDSLGLGLAQDKLSGSTFEVGKQQDALTTQLGNLLGKYEVTHAEVEKWRHENELAKAAEEARVLSLQQVATAQGGLNTATEEGIKALQDYSNQVLAAQGGAIGYAASQLQVEAAQRTLNEAVAKYGPTSLEARTAANQLEQAQLGVSAAAINAATKEAAFTSTLNQDAVPGLQAMRKTLIETALAHDGNTLAVDGEIAKIDGYIATAEKIPPAKTTKIDADTGQASRNVEDFNAKADHAARPRTVQFAVDYAGATLGVGPRGYAMGGVVPGPRGSPQLAVVHGGETIIPTSGARAATSSSGGGSSGGAGNTFTINVNVAAGVPPAQVGAAVVDQIRAYERLNGKSWRTS